MGRKKLQKKLNKRRVVSKRVVKNSNVKKLTPDQSTRANEMLKIALAKQQPTINTSDPNTIAMNKKMEELEAKHKKQIDALQERAAIREREFAEVRGERMHQIQKDEVERKIKFYDQAIASNKEQVKENKRFNELNDLKDEMIKKQSELSGIQQVVNSEEFKKPLEHFTQEYKNNELVRANLENEKAVFELIKRNREEEAKLFAIEQANQEMYSLKRPRFDSRFVTRDQNGHRMMEPLNQNTNKYINSGLKTFVLNNGKRESPKGPIQYNETEKKYKDADGREVFTYQYRNNEKTDYEMYQIQLQEQNQRYNDLQRRLNEENAKAETLEDMKNDISDMNIRNKKLESEIGVKRTINDQYYDNHGNPTPKLDNLHKEIADASHQKAINEARVDYTNERLEANKAELEEYKQKEFTMAMRDTFDSLTFKNQRDEIAEAQNRANLNRIARDKAQEELDMKKSMAEIENRNKLLQLSIQNGGFTADSLAQIQSQIASDAKMNVDDLSKINAVGKFKSQFDKMESIPQQMVNRILEKYEIDTNTIHNDPDVYNENVYNAALKVVNDVNSFVQQDPYTRISDSKFVEDYIIE